MLTWLADLSHVAGVFNLFRYLTFRTLGAATTGLLLVFFFGPMIISALRLRQGRGQPIRADGPASHLLTKKGTPTMGGLMILFGLFASSLLWASLESPYVWIVLFVTAGFAAIGFYDDYLKVTKQSHRGFSGRARLAAEFAIAFVACFGLMHVGAVGATSLALPFYNGYVVDLGWGFLLFGPFVIVAFGNAVNLTDGLDGLAIVPVMIAAAALGLIAYFAGNSIYAHYLLINHVPLASELIVICGALIGAGRFDRPPARRARHVRRTAPRRGRAAHRLALPAGATPAAGHGRRRRRRHAARRALAVASAPPASTRPLIRAGASAARRLRR